MARIARVVIPGTPHFIAQRGNRQMPVFFGDEDYHAYLDLLLEGCKKTGVEIWAYCLMPSFIQMIAVPPEKDSLRGAIADAHRRYARRINAQQQQRGHLWQDRYGSFPMDDGLIVPAAQHIERQPGVGVETYRWSSARAHLEGRDTALLKVVPVLGRVGGAAAWKTLLATQPEEWIVRKIQLHETTGRPLGDADFMAAMEEKTGRRLIPQKRGPKQK